MEPTALARLHDQAARYAAASKAPATLRAYASDWTGFRQWCQARDLPFLPATPETVALYLAAQGALKKSSTLARKLAAINKIHQTAGYAAPGLMRYAAVSEVLKGIRRTHGVAQSAKTPLLTADIRRLIAVLPESARGRRDRALLLLGFGAGLRRSEIAALDLEDVQETMDGLLIRLRRSKTDPEGQGRNIAIPHGKSAATCPLLALRAWRECLDGAGGPLFRAIDRHGNISSERLHSDSVALIVKRAARAAGLNAELYAGHSLRSGMATEAYRNGATELAIQRQTGHRSVATLRRYIREADLFRDNAAAKLGL